MIVFASTFSSIIVFCWWTAAVLYVYLTDIPSANLLQFLTGSESIVKNPPTRWFYGLLSFWREEIFFWKERNKAKKKSRTIWSIADLMVDIDHNYLYLNYLFRSVYLLCSIFSFKLKTSFSLFIQYPIFIPQCYTLI